ncbi:hypothetical protein ACQ4PT_015276 [Festuca glaucescens]
MGATGSRSSTTETLLVNIPKYSKLVRVPGGMHKVDVDQISFRGIQWNLKLQQKRVEVEEGVDYYLTVAIMSENREPAFGIDASVEILDETGEHTVFSAELCRGTWEEEQGCLHLGVYRRELEASSCVSRPDNSITVRYTLKERPRRLFRNWPSFKSKEQLPALSEVPMAATHTLTIGNLSELKAALLSWQSAYSTRFAVGGSRWYLSFCHSPANVRLFRASKEDDETRTTAEFSFTLEGAVNVQSHKIRHTFDRANYFYGFAYQPPEEPIIKSSDCLVVRCYIRVITPVVVLPTNVPCVATPAAASPSVNSMLTESLLTPLLSSMHG